MGFFLYIVVRKQHCQMLKRGKKYLQGKGELDVENEKGPLWGEREGRGKKWMGREEGRGRERVWEKKRESGLGIRGKVSLTTCLVRMFQSARADLCAPC